nr:hypothetical protein [Tanacetum cinerariifolium]
SPFFKAFLVTADVPEIYMQEFWATAYVHQHSIRFKMDTRKNIVDLEAFREMLHISPRVPGQSFDELPFEEGILDFLRFLGHSAQIKTLFDINVNKLFQQWRSFVVAINKCLTGKSFGFESFRLSQAQILWGLYHKRNIDYAFLIWEDFVYQVEYKNQKKSNEMYYPRFTKVIIHHFMTKKPSIPRRNKVNWHYVRDDLLFSTIKVAYKEYHACAIGEVAPKPKASARRKRGGFDSSTTPLTAIASLRLITTVAAALRLTVAAKGKQPSRATSPNDPSEVERTEAEQLKIVLRRSMQETHISQHGGSSTDKGTGSKPGVSDVPSDDSKEEISWNSSDEEDVDAQDKGRDDDEGKKNDESDAGKDDDDVQDDVERGDNDDDDDDKEETAKLDEQKDTESGEGDDEETKSDRESEKEETREEEEESFDPIPRTPEDSDDDGNGEEDQVLRVSEKQRLIKEEEADELYQRVKSLEVNFLEFMKTNQFVEAVSNIPGIVHQYMTQQMTEAVREAVQIQTDRFQDSFQRENDEFLRTINENMKKIRGRLSHSSRTSYAVATDLTEMELKKILMEKMEGNKSIQRSDKQRNLYKALVDDYEADKTILESYEDTSILKRRRGDDDDQEGPSTGSDRGSKRRKEGGEPESASTSSEPATRSVSRSTTGTQSRQMSATIQGSAQTWISELAKQADSCSSFNKLLDTPIDFSNFIMNRLCVDTLTPELLAGPTYELMRGSRTSLTELEYHLEEVYKATTDQLDWANPEGQQYPHNLLQPLPLIPNNRGRRVIPFAHFINNDLEYLRGGGSSKKYTTSVIKTKAAYYRYIKWIEDLERQQFYGFAVNRESAIDVYSKRRIFAVTDLKIVEWHNYKHLDWISIRRDDDKIYKFKEGDFKRLRL